MERDWTDNLQNWEFISRYSQWMYSTYSRFIGKRVVDIGAGTGNMVPNYLQKADRVVAVDIVDSQVDSMRERFAGCEQFSALKLDIMTEDIGELISYNFDTVVCVNVIEHIENDRPFLERLKDIVQKDGHIIVFAPAMPFIYSVFDENDGHYRRYDAKRLRGFGE